MPDDRRRGVGVENAEELLNLIDQRVTVHATSSRHWGTVVQRSTTGPLAQVVFEGSTVAMPVKVAGGVFALQGERCLLDRYGSDWVITGSWAATALGEASITFIPASTSGTLTSASYIDVTEIPSFAFTKAYDVTYVRLSMQAGGSGIVAQPVSMRYGLRITPVDVSSTYTATDYDMNLFCYNTIGIHDSTGCHRRVLSIPAGNYLISVRWKRLAGSGGVVFDQNDLFTIEVDEGVRTLQPFL